MNRKSTVLVTLLTAQLAAFGPAYGQGIRKANPPPV